MSMSSAPTKPLRRRRRPARRRPTAGRRLAGLALGGVWLLLAAAVGWIAFADVGVDDQLALASAMLGALLLLQVTRQARRLRLLVILICGFVTLRYAGWRMTSTLPDIATWSFVPGVLLFAAECYGLAMYFFGAFVNINPVVRAPAPLPDDPSLLPTVDVFVPSYNESAELLETTLTAARQMRYPPHHLAVYLLDDGGTEQRRADPDFARARAAEERHLALSALCERLGVRYLTRARNVQAKAGNINAALPRTGGELILVLDADHVPTNDFLEHTVGHFLRDPDLFLVQTPHFFINPDPIERNLDTFERMPSENEMFYCIGQHGLDYWNASFFCGSAALLRRRCLEEVGGIQDTSITEDAETALELHARGYRSAYVGRPMVAALSPETFDAFIGQRTRWAQGMLQILLLKNPLFKRGLSLPQRLCYLSSSVFWLFPLARLFFLLTPLTYLVFGMQIFQASFDEFLGYAVPHLICSYLLTNFLFGRVRWPFISELYELAQSLYLAPALLSVLLNPRAPTFKVTAKAQRLERNFMSHLATPLLALFGLLMTATAFGVWRYTAFPLERENLGIVLGWNIFNMIVVLAALGVVFERRQRRSAARMPRSLPVELAFGPHRVAATVTDLSSGGAQIALADDATVHGKLQSPGFVLHAQVEGGTEPVTLPGEVRHAVVADDKIVLGVRFTPETDAERAAVVRLCFGASEPWSAFQRARQQQRTIIGGFCFLLRLALTFGSASLAAALREGPLARSQRGAPATAVRPLMFQLGDAE